MSRNIYSYTKYVILQAEKLPDPFPIPKFRESTERNLQKKLKTKDDRRYMVRILATVLCTHIQKPSTRDCEVVGKSLVAKYPFLKEYVSVIYN